MKATGIGSKTVVHGGLDAVELAALGIDPKSVIDFSASINPLGPHSSVWDAMRQVDLSAYPDRRCTLLRKALSERHGVSPEQIIAGNGSTELIHLASQAFLAEVSNAVIFAPGFGEYAAGCASAGVSATIIEADHDGGFAWNLEDAVRTIERVSPGLVFLCNPNNPTGVYLGREFVLRVARAAGDGVLLLDEAYLPFVSEQWDSLPLLEQGNVLLLRSMTKDHALTGLRLGYAIGSEPLIELLGARQLSWSVNSLAQAAGVEALRHPEHALRGNQVVEEGRRYMISELRALGLEIAPSAANFVTVRVGDAAAVRRSLLGMGLCVRDCASFGMPEWIRIAVRTVDDCERLMAALKKVLAHG